VRGAIGKSTASARTRARTSWERAIAALASLAIASVTAVGCAGSDAPGFIPQVSGASTGHALEQDFTRVVRESLPSIVEITSQSGIGSGVIFDNKGDIVTNAHVVGTSANFQVRTSAGTQQFPATLVGSYPPEDLAVIRVQGAPNLKPAKFGRSSTLEVGDIVLAMGNPFGLDATVTDGLVSKLGRTIQEPPGPDMPGALLRQAIQTSAPINPGNSGGALVNLNSEVIGIPTLAAVNPELGGSAPGIGFAIPSDTATDIARQIVANGRVVNSKRAALGVSISTVTDQSGQPVGVGVFNVVPGGPAANAGLQNGDVITKVDDVPVATAQQLQEVLAARKPGDTMRITLIRPPGETKTVTVTLGELAAS
jgi:S1-C subfamily serine protease